MTRVVPLLTALLLLAVGCGSDDGGGGAATTQSTPTISAEEAETALVAEISQGGGGSGIVHHEHDRPELVTCRKEAGAATGWRCTVKPAKGQESYICVIEVDPRTKQATKTTCARVDN